MFRLFLLLLILVSGAASAVAARTVVSDPSDLPENAPAWKLEEYEANWFKLTPPDGRPTVIISERLANSIIEKRADPEVIYRSAISAFSEKKKQEDFLYRPGHGFYVLESEEKSNGGTGPEPGASGVTKEGAKGSDKASGTGLALKNGSLPPALDGKIKNSPAPPSSPLPYYNGLDLSKSKEPEGPFGYFRDQIKDVPAKPLEERVPDDKGVSISLGGGGGIPGMKSGKPEYVDPPPPPPPPETPAPPPVEPEPDPPPPKPNCETAAKSFTSTVNFPAATSACAWGIDGNLGKASSKLSARLEQAASLSLPKGAVVCEMSLSSSSQSMHYDDHIFFLFNDYVLASSVSGNVSTLSSTSISAQGKTIPGYKYSWDSLKGKSIAGGDYCLGGAQGLSSCQIPATDTTGSIAMRFDPAIIKAISAPGTTQTLTFITTGDDNSTDCQHSAFSLKVDAIYYIP